MKPDNPFSREFLSRYPIEAARVLEQISSFKLAAFFNELSLQISAPVIEAMLPRVSAACLELMDEPSAAKLAGEIQLSSCARIYRLLNPAKQDAILTRLPEKTKNRLRKQLAYHSTSAGALMDPGVDMLPQDITVADAIRRLERFSKPANCEIYISDNAHRLVGFIEIGRLIMSTHNDKLQDVMSRKIRSISVHASIEALLSHPAWKTRRTLPVVERDSSLAGTLHYSQLQDAISISSISQIHDPMNSLLSLASLYWLSLAQLLESVMGISKASGEKR